MNLFLLAKAMVEATDALNEFKRTHEGSSEELELAKTAAEIALRKGVLGLEDAVEKRPDRTIRTVKDLRLAMVDIDMNDFPDAMPLARRGGFGDNWKNGFDQIGLISLVTLGHFKRDRLTVSVDNDFYKNFAGKRSTEFSAIAFD